MHNDITEGSGQAQRQPRTEKQKGKNFSREFEADSGHAYPINLIFLNKNYRLIIAFEKQYVVFF